MDPFHWLAFLILLAESLLRRRIPGEYGALGTMEIKEGYVVGFGIHALEDGNAFVKIGVNDNFGRPNPLTPECKRPFSERSVALHILRSRYRSF